MTSYYNEIDPYAAAWLRNLIAAGHIAPGDVDERSIEDVRPDDLRGYTQCHFFAGIGVWSYALRLAGVDDSTRIWTGSCPCQPFSAAGKGDGFADERHLWPAWLHLISQCEPARILGEQVASKDAEPWLDLVSADLEGLGFAFGALAFPSAGVGAPHIRDRTYFMAYANNARSQGWGSVRQRTVELSVRARGMASVVADAYSISSGQGSAVDGGRHSRGDALARSRPSCNGMLERIESAGPTNGFWRDADWLLCRDEKWRPVIASHVQMVDGPASSVVRVCAGKDYQEAEMNHEPMQAMFERAGQENILQRTNRRPVDDETSNFLQSEMHGAGNGGGDEKPGDQKQSPAVCEKSAPILRNVPCDGETPCAPQGREPDEQRGVELDDLVSLLPSSLSLAELHGDWRSAEALRVLRGAIYEEGLVLHPYQPIQEVWASIGKEAQDRIRLGFDASRWKKLVAFPLQHDARNRVGKLRAYGNAINAYQAAEFIGATLDV